MLKITVLVVAMTLIGQQSFCFEMVAHLHFPLSINLFSCSSWLLAKGITCRQTGTSISLSLQLLCYCHCKMLVYYCALKRFFLNQILQICNSWDYMQGCIGQLDSVDRLAGSKNHSSFIGVICLIYNLISSPPTVQNLIISDIAWLHHLDFKEMHWEKGSCEQHKDTACCFEQILEAAPYKTAVVQPLISYLTNHLRCCQRWKVKVMNNLLFGTSTYELSSVDWVAKTQLSALCKQ